MPYVLLISHPEEVDQLFHRTPHPLPPRPSWRKEDATGPLYFKMQSNPGLVKQRAFRKESQLLFLHLDVTTPNTT